MTASASQDPVFHGTTIVSVRRNGQVAIGGEPIDGFKRRMIGQHLTHDLRGLLGAQIGANQHAIDMRHLLMQPARHGTGLFPPDGGQRTSCIIIGA